MLYAELLGQAYAALSERLGVNVNAAECKTFSESIRGWMPFPDTVAALHVLSKHFRLIVLSNVDHDSFSYTRQKLEGPGKFTFDKVITAQDVGSYKPGIANFQYMLRIAKAEFDIDPAQVLVTAQSLFHDHEPATALGLDSAWIARQGSEALDNNTAHYTYKFATLGEFAAAVEEEQNKILIEGKENDDQPLR
jgi:2-haloalkanoic acid dehalogenase type II